MKRLLVGLSVVLGLGLVALGVAFAVTTGTGRSDSPVYEVLGFLLGLVALVVALWKVRGQLDADSEAPVPWAAETFATPAPERTTDEHPLSGDWFGSVVENAAQTARSDGTIEAGLEVVRPALREALVDAMVAGGMDRPAATESLATGEWTDDPVAASVLDADLPPPPMTLRERIRAWLFPERTLRRRVRQAGHAVAVAADASLPTVPGQTAPRTVPVRKPRLEDLKRGATGEVQAAVDPNTVARGPESAGAESPVPASASDGQGDRDDVGATEGAVEGARTREEVGDA